jgi:hypothetical protein
MTKHFFFKKYYVIFLLPLFILGGCNNDKETDKTNTAEPVTSETTSTETAAAPIAAGLTGGKLDTLWITAPEFKLLNTNKALFIFYFGTMDTVSIHGWKDKGGADPFNTDPDIKLLKGHPDAVLTYGPGTYFGNLVLKNVNQLINKINNNQATHVIFAPKKLGDHVYYDIFLSKEPHLLSPKPFALIPTGDVANPSPPKTY